MMVHLIVVTVLARQGKWISAGPVATLPTGSSVGGQYGNRHDVHTVPVLFVGVNVSIITPVDESNHNVVLAKGVGGQHLVFTVVLQCQHAHIDRSLTLTGVSHIGVSCV